MRVGVVGAGFAGLAAGTHLAAAGADVVVLEARDRVGGRVWSELLIADGRPLGVVERGAEFVLDGYESLRRHAADAGLHLVDTGMSYYVRDVPGLDPDALREAGLRLVRAAVEAPAGTGVVDVLDDLGLPDDLAAALVARTEISCAFPVEALDAANLPHVVSFAPSSSHRIAEGNQALARALAARLGDRLHLATPVRRVAHGAGGVALVTDRDELHVDRAVVAVPLPVSRALSFEPALPDWKQRALDTPAMGQAAKLHLPLDERPSTSAVMSVEDRFWMWTATTGDGEVAPILHAFAGSPPALDRLGVADGADRWVDRARRLRPDLHLLDEGALLTTWSDDPWALGAYAAWPPGSPAGVRDGLARAVGPVHFAGEHTAGPWSGLMEGALRSGERAAVEILRDDRPT